MNVKFQLNLPSLTNAYGKQARGKAMKLLKSGTYDLIGTDIHSFDMCRFLSRLSLCKGLLQALRITG
jgi:tyrosine-protein phosphatase YwqE